MNTLSENTIKKAAIVFLKNYYKHRPRTSPTTASLDLKTFGGIIADGRVSFQTDEEKEFIATFEASSLEKIEEVKYKPLRVKLFWDSIATALALIATMYLFGIAERYFSITHFGLAGGITAILTLLFAIFFLLHSLLKPYSRFKYIYAIEQFKEYHADEQWIAIGEDVFDNPENPYFLELKKQCVSNGIGLIEVDHLLEVRTIITASREQVLEKQRDQKSFFENDQIVEAKPKRIKPGLKKLYSKIWPADKIGRSVLRFRKANINQILISSFALALIGYFIYFEYDAMGPAYVNEKKYEIELENLAKNPVLETPSYLVDSIGETPFNAKYIPFDFVDQSKPIPDPVNVLNEAEENVIVGFDATMTTAFDCERLYNFEGELFLIQHSLYENVTYAEEMMYEMNALGLETNVVWLGCFEGDENRYAVYYRDLFPDKKQAIKAARTLRKALTNLKQKDEIAIRRIYFEH